MERRGKGLKGREKAAVLLVSLGPDVASRVYKNLDESTIEMLTMEIAGLRKIPSNQREEVLREAQELLLAKEYMTQGGVDYAKQLLESALGPERAQDILRRITASLQVRPFDFIRQTDPQQILAFVQNEHPQTIALIVSYMEPKQAAQVMGGLPPKLQAEVAKRIATMERVTPDVLREVERVLERKVSTILSQDFTIAGGIDALVAIVNNADRATERNIMERLEEEDPELAEEVKKRLFVFEDILGMDDRSLQRVLRDVDMKDVALALKGASEALKKSSSRTCPKAAEMLKEDMEYMGPVRVRDVEEAQQKIVNVIRALEDAGEIVIARGGEEELIV